jgi:hypothetical protein
MPITSEVARRVFQTENPDLGKYLEGPKLENVDIFNGHYEYFTDICDIL